MIKTAEYYSKLRGSKIKAFLDLKETKKVLLRLHELIEIKAIEMKNEAIINLDYYNIKESQIDCYMYFFRGQGFLINYNKENDTFILIW